MRRVSGMSPQVIGVVVGLVLLSCLGGCGGGPAQLDPIFWPPAPNEPVIEYVASYDGSAELKRSFLGKIRDFFIGRDPDLGLGKPYGLCHDGDRKLYVVDTARKAVVVLDFRKGKARVIASLGAYGRLVEPVNAILDADGNLVVADTGLRKLVVFDPEGNFDHFIGEGELTSPVGLALHPAGDRLYVSDSNRHEVKIFSLGGELLGSIGERGDQQGQFYHPLGIGIHPDGMLYVVDSFHFAVQVFDLDGHFKFSFGSTKEAMGSLARPRAIAFDSDGHVYVTDALRNNVQIFEPDGTKAMDFGMHGLQPGQFRLPAGICTTEDDRIFVVDSVNGRIQEFRYLPTGQGREKS